MDKDINIFNHSASISWYKATWFLEYFGDQGFKFNTAQALYCIDGCALEWDLNL